MAASHNFRTAFNGFNRDDVVHYIEYLNSKYETDVNQLKSEAQTMQMEMDQLRAAARRRPEDPELKTKVGDLEKQVAALNQTTAEQKETIAALQAQLADREKALEEAKAALAAAEAELASLRQAKPVSKGWTEEELAAYRRAESAERRAQERVANLYDRANGTLADTSAKLDDVSARVGRLADQVLGNLNALQAAVSESKAVLRDAAATMYAIKPEDKES